MVAFKAFDPDPDISDPEDPYFGTGTWHYDDGTSAYGQGDPEEARALYKPPAQPDERTAAFTPADASAWAAEGGQQAPPTPGTEALKANEPQTDVPTHAAAPEQQSGAVQIPRSSRIAWIHNNPGNLKFVGQEGAAKGEPAEDGGYWAAFESPEDGVAALNRQVELDAGRGQTVREFVSKYAPPGSNDTEQYIAQASQALGADPNAKLADLDRSKVVAFMAQKESGTDLGGGSSLPAQAPARRPLPGGLPASMGGMQPSVAEMRGTPLTPGQLEQRQQGIYDSTMSQVGAAQNAAAERQRGRDEGLALVEDQSNRFKASQEAQLAQATATKLEAQKNVQQAMATQLDPGRVIKNMSAGQIVLGVVGLMLGGLGQTLQQRGGQRGAQNNAVATLEKVFNDDIEQQKEDKKSRVAHWTNVFRDAEMGEKAARAEMWNAAGRLAEQKAQHATGNAEIQAQMMQQSAEMMARGQAEANGLVDKENERLSIRYQAPDPQKLGGVDLLAQALKVDSALEQSGYSREQRHQMLSRMGLPPPSGESTREQKTREDQEARDVKAQELTETEGKAEAGWQTMQQYAQTVGLTRDPGTGKLHAPEGMNLGWKLGKMTEIDAAREAAIEGLARLQTGAAISANEEERFKKLLGNKEASLEEIATNLNALDAVVQSRRKQTRVQPTSAPSGWK